MVKFLLDHGFSVFIASWKNPGADMRDTRFEDYVTQGVGKIVQVAREVSGSPKVHAVGHA